MYLLLFTNNSKLCNIVIDKGNKYFVGYRTKSVAVNADGTS